MAKTDETGSELLLRIRWYIHVRWFLLAAVIIPTLLSLYIADDNNPSRILGTLESASLLAGNLIFYCLSRFKLGRAYYKALGIAILGSDILFVTALLHFGGGVESRMMLLYAVPIMMAAPLFGRVGVYCVAAGSAVMYDMLVLSNYFGWIKSPNSLTSLGANPGYVVYSVTIFTTTLIIVGVVTDFLTRLLIQKEREATVSAEALKRAQAIAHVGSWEWNVWADEVTWSDELYRIFGVSKDVPIDFATFIDYIHPEDRQRVADTILHSIKRRHGYSFDHRVIRPDKTERIVHGEGKVLLDRHNRVIRLIGTSQDITAERALEIAKGDFVALASHQLRTPASGVRMLLAMLHDGYAEPLTPSQMELVQEAFDANQRLLHISDDLLNVAKLESGRLMLTIRPVDARQWLTNVVSPHKLLAREHRQRLILAIPKGTWQVACDPERLAMVLDNILSNARKYTPARGVIRVDFMPGPHTYKLIVSDTGSGMTRTEIANLFGKFTRLDNPASRGVEGTGLGLYLAKSIVDLHRGSIKVTSKPGAGSVFTITLPRHSTGSSKVFS